MVFKAFELAAFLNKLLLIQLTRCFTAVPVLLYFNLNPSPIEVSGSFATDPQEKGLGCKFAVLGLTFLSLEKQLSYKLDFAPRFLCFVML